MSFVGAATIYNLLQNVQWQAGTKMQLLHCLSSSHQNYIESVSVQK